MPVTGMRTGFTVTWHTALLPPADAVMLAEPSPTAFTTPLDTVATLVLELDQVTSLSVALEGETVALRLTVPPTARVIEVWFNDTLETATTGSSGGVQPITKPRVRTAIIKDMDRECESFFIRLKICLY